MLGDVLTQALAFLAQEQDELEAERQASRAAYLLAETAAATSDNVTIKKAVTEMVASGAMGEMLGAMLLASNRIQGQKLKLTFKGLETNQLLAVVNRFLAQPRAVDTKLLAWASETVHQQQSEDPEEVLVFLDGLAKRDERPAHAVQRELLHGRFGFWLQELLGLDLDAEQARYMADTASRLDWQPLSGRLLRLLKFASAEELPHLFGRVRTGWEDPGGRMAKASLLFFKHKSPEVKLAAAGVLVRLGSPQAAPALAKLFAGSADTRAGALGMVLTLPPKEFLRFAKALPAKLRPVALTALIGSLARVDPGWLKTRLAKSKSPSATAVRALIKGRKRAAHSASFTPAAPKSWREDKDQPGLFGKVKQLVGGKDTNRDLANEFLISLQAGAKPQGKVIKAGAAPGLKLQKIAFNGCTLGQLDLRQCVLGGVRFVKCRFKGVDFSRSRFKKGSFTDCDFQACRFSGCAMEDVAFERCSFARTHMDATLTKGLAMTTCKWDEGSLWGARLEGAAIRSCRFSLADFSRAALIRADLDGVEFSDCVFQRTFIEDSRVDNAGSRACLYQSCSIAGLAGDEPGLLCEAELALDALCAAVAAREKITPAKAPLSGDEGIRFMLGLVEGWLFERDVARRRHRVLAANRRRMDWCAAKLGGGTAKVLGMLPGLMEAPAVVNDKNPEAAPPCRITGYTPGYTALGDLAAHFGTDTPPRPAEGNNAPSIRIEAFYSIGSVGTIAQTRGSDIDMWVCLDASKASDADLKAFRKKLVVIEEWADREHELELHFFVMDLDAVRDNNFGFSDKESAGSSQALLLKEEFYRTAVVLAGPKLAWWFMEPGAGPNTYAKHLARIQAAASIPPKDVVDLGAMTPIPKDEFFGASLWQIVKALKSPFKSIMKFAVLDKYLSGGDADVLLCNRLLAAVHAGRTNFWRVDPYAVLYSEVEGHYSGTGNDDARKLMRMAFEQKTHYSDQTRTTGRHTDMQGWSWLEFFYPYSADQQPGGAPIPGKDQDTASFARLHELGQMVARYMFGTYDSISKGVANLDVNARITGQDLTKLGRKIFGHFKSRANKVAHIPFLESPRELFSAIEVVCEGQPGTPRTWLGTGEPAGRKKSQPEELHREKHPVALLTWLAANHLYTPDMPIRGANLQAPVSTPDLRALLDALVDCFPPKKTFDPEIEETLRDEEMVKAFICVNFTADREVREFKDVTLIYATNWGELFCVTTPKALNTLEKDPLAFLQANTEAHIAPDVHIQSHYPKKSLAPRIVEM